MGKLSTIYSGVQLPQTHSKAEPYTKRCETEPADSFIDKVNNWQLSDNSTESEEEKVKKKSPKKKKGDKKSTLAADPTPVEYNPVIKDLHDSIANGDVGGVTHVLLANGIQSITASDQSASSRDNAAIVNKLYKGSTALHTAASNGNADIVYTLLSHGADPSIKYVIDY